MPKITAWQCTQTKKLFADQRDYVKHLRKLARIRLQSRREANVSATFDTWLSDEKAKITHPDQLAPWILKNQRKLMDAANAIPGMLRWESDKFYHTDKFTEFSITLRWHHLASNSHSCPKGGVTNWGGRTKMPDGSPAPSGYPGWIGQARGVLEREKKHNNSYPYDAILRLVGIHTGSGGGGNKNWSYGVTLFESEWPGLTAAHERALAWNAVANSNLDYI